MPQCGPGTRFRKSLGLTLRTPATGLRPHEAPQLRRLLENAMRALLLRAVHAWQMPGLVSRLLARSHLLSALRAEFNPKVSPILGHGLFDDVTVPILFDARAQ